MLKKKDIEKMEEVLNKILAIFGYDTDLLSELLDDEEKQNIEKFIDWHLSELQKAEDTIVQKVIKRIESAGGDETLKLGIIGMIKICYDEVKDA